MKPAFCFLLVLLLLSIVGYGQTDTVASNLPFDTTKIHQQKDIRDVVHHIFNPNRIKSDSGDAARDMRKHYSFVPALGYTLQTGFAGIASANMAYYNDLEKNTKQSSISTNVTYSQYRQVIVPFIADIWTKGNRYNFITDIRFISYPSDIYGLGGRTDPNKGVTINFSGLKIHQTVMKAVSENVYMGIGYYYDKFWDIKPIDQVSRGVNHIISRELGTRETASGPAVRFLYDTRLNQLNPQQGIYYSISYRSNMKALGSDSSSQSLQIDARTYFHFPANSKNVLALWNFDWLTTSGTPPYLALPSTGWDDNYNTGRGYIQGRFRGRKMFYFESEYRFGITNNGLLGGVAFANLQNFSADLSAEYSKVFIGYGVGLRIKLNKYSGANLCIDYGFGQNGSHGFFVNLGEVF
ncbi:MAG: BamA/TamA family outer membrane protein [Chitinophagaceae bacterium]